MPILSSALRATSCFSASNSCALKPPRPPYGGIERAHEEDEYKKGAYSLLLIFLIPKAILVRGEWTQVATLVHLDAAAIEPMHSHLEPLGGVARTWAADWAALASDSSLPLAASSALRVTITRSASSLRGNSGTQMTSIIGEESRAYDDNYAFLSDVHIE